MNGKEDKIDQDIEELTKRIQNINIQRTVLLQEELIYEEQLRTLRKEQHQRSNNQLQISNNVHKDRDGNDINIGDRVRFLTRGVIKTSEGTVKSFGRRFVISISKEGFEISRLAKNLKIIRRSKPLKGKKK